MKTGVFFYEVPPKFPKFPKFPNFLGIARNDSQIVRFGGIRYNERMSEISVLRREIKYVVAETEAAEIKRELAAVMSPDAHSPSGSYRVRSLYFDTLNNRDYFAKLAGIESRSKLRLRVYSASDETAKLEIKRKWGEYQRKDTLTLTRRDAERLIRGEYVCLLDYAGALPAELYARLTLGVYRPAAMIEYRARRSPIRRLTRA